MSNKLVHLVNESKDRGHRSLCLAFGWDQLKTALFE